MLFPTTDFAIFLCIVFAGNWLLMPASRAWKTFMIVASYVFYAWWDPSLVWLLAVVTVVAQAGALRIDSATAEQRRKLTTLTAVSLTLMPLLWFKYYGFVSVTAANVLDPLGFASPLPLMQIVLPVGISFYTFMAISYVVDIHRKELQPASWTDFFLYLSFFPHLVAGPIVRAGELIPQFAEPRDPDRIDVSQAARLIFRGLFKKVVISSYLATEIVDPVFADPGAFGALDALFAVYGYAIVIYADFSGYTDIAIGVAELLGFRFPQNFDRPYVARSLQDFWRRWHMTLSRWLRDYLYIPLGGSRRSEERVYFNIIVTMLLGGLWHGAGWTFVAWGAIHGGSQAIGHYRRNRHATKGRLPQDEKAILVQMRQRFITFHIVCFGWIFFRATSFEHALDLLGRFFSGWGEPATLLTPMIVVVIAAALLVQYAHLSVRMQAAGLELWNRFGNLSPVSQGVIGAILLFGITTMGPEGVAPFIYFQF